ncbi:MAG: hypothetical protein J6R32_03115 [Bacteroidales bacterium]|nr:hypothetical protein [Bacteroidales bacterium]
MKIIVSYEKMNFVDLTEEEMKKVKEVAGDVIIKEVANGYTVKADKATMYQIICGLSFQYDIEIV